MADHYDALETRTHQEREADLFKRLPDILRELGHTAEGVHTEREVLRLSRELKVEMPITAAVCSILYDGVSAGLAVEALLNREPKTENY